ncbi:S10 family serine carboxypeptidase-like protein [Luteimonas abyssi]|uniref:S10 family serine carboxypeptidase-like protein n=1 Tax=Luteimonas abyssi TaxID=1247514 RepID=UPI00138F5FA0|nr:hypothetical protein [Luteimonas abyssi]
MAAACALAVLALAAITGAPAGAVPTAAGPPAGGSAGSVFDHTMAHAGWPADESLPEAARTVWSWPGGDGGRPLAVTVIAEELPMTAGDGIDATMFSTSYLVVPDVANADGARDIGPSATRPSDINAPAIGAAMHLRDAAAAGVHADAGAGTAAGATAPRATPAGRPVVFFWNGGPGSAAVGLHATFAPRTPGAAPDRADARGSTDNPDSPIDIADLVFVDPVGTGHSRVLRDGAGAGYWGVTQDAEAAARFVSAWLRRHGREGDPVVLVGQSYAGIRVPLAAHRLVETMPGLDLRGLLLVAPSTGGVRANAADAGAGDATRADAAGQADRARVRCHGQLAVYAQTAAHHGVGAQAGRPPADIAADIEAFLAGRERFDADDHARIAADIGLPVALVAAADGCVAPLAFQTGLLAARGDRVGTADTRLHAPLALTRTRQPPYDDPSTSPYTLDYDLDAAWRHHLRHEIGYRPAGAGDDARQDPYLRLSLAAHGAWDWTWPDWAGASTAPVLAGLLDRVHGLQVLVAVGYYDLSVVYLEPVRVFEAAGLPGPRFVVARYPAGHAVHSDRPARERSFADLRALIGGAR